MRQLAGQLVRASMARFATWVLFGLVALGLSEARAGVLQFTSKAAFVAQTDVALSENFDHFGPGLNYLSAAPSPAGLTFTQATYVIGANTVASNSTPPLIWNPIRNVTLYAYGPLMSANIDTLPSRYSSFGFDLGYLNNFVSATHPATTATVVLSTLGPGGSGTYTLSVTMPGSEESFAFSGFKTDDPQEYFTAFQISGPTSFFPGISEWKLGNPKAPPPAIPEPGTLVLAGLASLILLGRSQASRFLAK
ncbi:MAG: PEP-CTERM sorting domain-containing protein [Planctomycetaceae bacterium]|jgi:hypothetical protein